MKRILTKIVSPNSDDSIVFNYTPIIQEHYSYNQIQYTALPPLAAGAATEFCQGDYPAMTLQRSRELILNSVVYTNGTTITFNRGYNRLDLATNTVLDNIRISNAGEEIGYKFNYEYVSCNIASSYPNFPYADYSTYGTSQELYTRLNLNSIKRFNSADTIPFYQFNYNPDKLPELTNTGYADIYGYATSVATGKNRIQQYNFQGISAAGGLNTPDQTAFTPMSLNKIILPTGGEVNVEYEPNTTQTDINGKNDIGLTSIEKVGGLRVKSITQTDGTGQANALTHWYKYVEADGSTSSGVIANFPMFGYKYTETLLPYNVYVPHTYHKIQDCAYGPYSWPSNVAGSPVDFLIRSKNPLNALINTHGSCVGYGRVEEYLGTYSNYTKKIVHRFTTPDTYPVPVSLMDNNFPFPYIPDVDYAWGLPLEIDEFSKTNQLLSKSVNTYSVSVDQITDPNFMGLKVGLKKFPANDLSCYGIKHFLPITGKVFLTNTAETVYFPVGKSMVNNTSFDYDVSKNILTHIHAKNAKDEDIRTDFYYPYQFTSTGAIALLNTADRIYQPIRTETWKVSGTGQLLAVSASELGVFDHVPRIARTHAYTPSQTISSTMWGSFNPNQVLQSPQYYTPFATAEKYDSRGNLEQKTLRGITNTTLWGYNKTFPVARVINAAYADVAYTSFEDDMFGWQLAAGASAGITSTAFNGKFGGYAGGGVTLEKNSLNPGKTYIVTLWSKFVPMVKADVGGSLTPITLTAGEEHNGWTFFKGKFSNASYVWVGDDPSGTNIDELRLYPDGAVMTTKTYNPLFGISSECDAASNIVYYEYDGFGRMKYKRDPDGNILEAYEYQIQQPKY